MSKQLEHKRINGQKHVDVLLMFTHAYILSVSHLSAVQDDLMVLNRCVSACIRKYMRFYELRAHVKNGIS